MIYSLLLFIQTLLNQTIMKRLYLLFALCVSALLAVGQSLKIEKDASAKLIPGSEPAAGVTSLNPSRDMTHGTPARKAGGDLIWGTSFNWENPSDEKGWTSPSGWEIIDNSDLGNYWVWRKDTIVHYYYRDSPRAKAVPPTWFDTPEDGYLCMPLSDYNNRDGISTSNLADATITTPPIDCSNASSVVVQFNQYFVFCCSNYNLDMLVTNDGGNHWATYSVRFNVAGNILTPEKVGRVEINISDIAAGMSNVQVRFYIHGFQLYFWIIDDLKLTEAYDNNLILEDTWADFDGGLAETVDPLHICPKDQMGIPGSTEGSVVGRYFFRGAVLNAGINAAENARLNLSILKNGQEILNTNAPAGNIYTLDRDTIHLPDPWLAEDFGDYRINFTAVSDNGDDLPGNNTGYFDFTVDDTMGLRTLMLPESDMNTGKWSGGGNAGDMVVTNYFLPAPAEINSISAYIVNWTPAETPQFQFVLMKEIEDNYEEWAVTDVIDMDSTYMNQWVTLPIQKDGEIEFLEPGNYYTCVRMWGYREDRPNGTQGMTVGRDLTTKFSGCPQYYATDATWHNLAGKPLPMIGYNISASGGPTEAPVTFNVDMTGHIASGEFHPSTDFVDVTGTFNAWGGSAHFTDPEGDGIYTLTIDGLDVADMIEYKYRINGSIAELQGAPDRKYTVRYWNVINDIFNNGLTAGVDPGNLVASFSVYPNPNNGSFNLEITNTVPSDLTICLTNIQGQVVYRNQVTRAIHHQETIGSSLAEGIYFLTVNNGKEVKVQKIIVQ
jgi:hypothetical protein